MANNTVEVRIQGDSSRLERAINKARDAINQFGNAGSQASRRLQQSMNAVRQSVTNTNTRFQALRNSINELDFDDVLGGSAVFTALGASVTKVIDKVQELQSALGKLQSLTGASDAEMESLGTSLGNVYANVGGDINEVANVLGRVKQLTGATGTELESAGQAALLLSKNFDIDPNESIRAADNAAKQFHVSLENINTLMAQMAQNGVDKNGDLADTMNEYSVHYAQLGFNPDEMANQITNAVKSGVFSVDKVGDAMKEFGINVKSMDKSAVEAFESMGLNADEMAHRFASGGDTAKQAFIETLNALEAIEDPVERNTAGVGLFRTMWEDCGETTILNLRNINGELDMTADTLSKLQIANISSIGGIFDYIGRQIETAFILPLIQEAMPALKDFASFLTEFFASVKQNGLAETFKNMIPPEFKVALGAIAGIISGVLVASISGLVVVAAPLAGIFASAVAAAAPIVGIGAAIGVGIALAITAFSELGGEMNFFGTAADSIMQIVSDLTVDFLDAFSQIYDSGVDFVNSLSPLLESLMPILEPLAEFVGGTLLFSFTTTFGLIGDIVGTAAGIIADIVSGIIDIFTGIITFLTGVFTGDWDTAWNGVVQIFSGAFDMIYNIGSSVLNGLLDMVNTVISGINSVVGTDFSGFNTGTPAHNAKGGIYSRGAFLTYFAEDSAEAAIPIDGSNRAKALWTKTGEMLGMFRSGNAEGLSIANSISGNSYSSSIETTAKADVIVKTDKALSDIEKLNQKIKDLQNEGKEVSPNLYTSINDKNETLKQNISEAFDKTRNSATDLNKNFVDFKIQSNFSHLKGAEAVQAQMIIDTTDAFDKLDEYKQKYVDSTKQAQDLVEAARKSGDEKLLADANALLEQRKADEAGAERWIAQEKQNIMQDYFDEQVASYKNCKDIQTEIDEAYNDLNLERLQEVLTEENAIRLNNMEAQKEMMDTYQEVFLAANATNAQLISDLYGTVYDSLGENINSLIMGTQTWGDAIRNLGASLIQTVVNFYAQKLAGMITASLMGESMEKASAAKSTALAAQQAAAWATAALYKEMVMPGTSAIALGSLAASSVGASALTATTSIPALANGGITKGATVAMIGEGRYQEAVMPLNRSYFEKAGLINDNTGNQYNINISAVDAKSVEKLFKKNGRNLVKGLANQSFKSTGRGQAV